MSKKLLPPNSTKLEKSLADTVRQDLIIPIRALWNPDKCPEELLPYLAWERSVDRWDMDWDTKERREVIKNSFSVHKYKGTIQALRDVIEPFGYISKIIEWWQTDPLGVPGTFKIVLSSSRSIEDDLFVKMVNLIDNARPVTRHLTSIEIQLETEGKFYCGAANYNGISTTIYPKKLPPDKFYIGAVSYGASLSTTYPQIIREPVNTGTLYSSAVCIAHEKITIYPKLPE